MKFINTDVEILHRRRMLSQQLSHVYLEINLHVSLSKLTEWYPCESDISAFWSVEAKLWKMLLSDMVENVALSVKPNPFVQHNTDELVPGIFSRPAVWQDYRMAGKIYMYWYCIAVLFVICLSNSGKKITITVASSDIGSPVSTVVCLIIFWFKKHSIFNLW